MTEIPFGRLQDLPPREAWPHEAHAFTPWLAENIDHLAEAIGIKLELTGREVPVQTYSADLLARNVQDDTNVLIENQLEKTDHLHLGQLMTYAAGLQAVTIVWVAAQFVEEHRAALDWLNDITDEKFRFFGLEVELWRIGDSPAAPKFNIISKPNEWTRSIGRAKRQIESEALTETRARQLKFWETFRDHLQDADSPLRPHKPRPQHWTNFGVGRAGIMLGALLNFSEKRIGVEVYIGREEAKSIFRELEEQRIPIEEELGFPMSWEFLPERVACRIIHFTNDYDPTDEDCWPDAMDWLKVRLEALNRVFRPRLRQLNFDAMRATEAEETR